MCARVRHGSISLNLIASRFSLRLGTALRARGDADVRKAQQPLDSRPFAHVITFQAMADVLQAVPSEERCQRQIPLRPGTNDKQRNPGQDKRDAGHM
jgi:hypothetical protein